MKTNTKKKKFPRLLHQPKIEWNFFSMEKNELEIILELKFKDFFFNRNTKALVSRETLLKLAFREAHGTRGFRIESNRSKY